MPNEGTYPHKPHRPNFTDIRTMQIFDPQVIGNTGCTEHWFQVSITGATLENGVRIKNSSSGTHDVYIGYGGNGDWQTAPVAPGGTTADTGFKLEQAEEVFVEVRRLGDIWMIGSAEATVPFIAS